MFREGGLTKTSLSRKVGCLFVVREEGWRKECSLEGDRRRIYDAFRITKENEW